MGNSNIIEFLGDNLTFIWKYPEENFSLGSQLIIRESQEAIFFLDGKALDLFGPGRHTLISSNLPQMNKIFDFKTKQAPFSSELYFINLTEQLGIKWGTDSRVQFLEPKFNFPLTLGASGEMGLKVSNSRKLLLKVLGTERSLSQSKLLTMMKSILMTKIKSYIASTIREGALSIFQIDEHLDTFSQELKQKLSHDFHEYGLEITLFNVTTLAKPDGEKEYEKFKELFFRQYSEVYEAKLNQQVEIINANTEAQRLLLESEALAKKRLQEGYTYQSERSFDVAEKIAENEATGQLTNLGVGLGMMAGVAGTVAGTTQQAVNGIATSAPVSSCIHCGHSIDPQAKFCTDCGQSQQPVIKQLICSKCNTHISGMAKFCSHCGNKLVQ